ncbi:MAG TPA: TetR/AcrR family transcriptional regulator [Blastocatellia bacterium]|nr:TetR/AcrR family transcriptional regulator [Blastocatellia bacterium]
MNNNSKITKSLGGHRIHTSVKDEALVQKRRQQICEAALKAFTENGFHETNLKQVTKLAGLAYGSIYDYVKTKDDILFLIYDNVLSELSHRLQDAAKESDDPVEQIKALIRAAMEHTDEYQEAIILLYQESRVMKTSGHLSDVFGKERSYLRIFSEVLERGVKRGVFNIPNSQILENVLPLMCSAWALKRWNLKGVTRAEYTEALARFVLQGIEATAGETRKRFGSAVR